MSQRLIQPGREALMHPRTHKPVVPLGYGKRGPIWPVLGADDNDDPDDSRFTDDDDDDEDETDEDEDDVKDKPKKKSKAKTDDDDDEDDKPKYTQYEYDRMRTRMKRADQRASGLETRLKALEAKTTPAADDKDKDGKPDPAIAKELAEAKAASDKLTARNRKLEVENAFHAVNKTNWVDVEDALAAAERLELLEDVVDEDGTVDRKALARALRELAKRKPHLVKKAQSGDDDDEDDGDGETPPATTRRVNGTRKGSKTTTDRAALQKRFPALRS